MFITDRSGQTFSLPLSTLKNWAMILNPGAKNNAMILNPGARNNAIECNSVQDIQLSAAMPSTRSTSKTINRLIN
jgi:hypothetical protein